MSAAVSIAPAPPASETRLRTSPAEVLKRHEGLARYHARRFVRPGVEFDDLLQEARLGLLAAAERWRAIDGGSPVGKKRKPRGSVTYQGRSGTLATFAKEAGISMPGLYERVKSGMTVEQAIEAGRRVGRGA